MDSETQIEKELVRGMKRIAVPYRTALGILREHQAAAKLRTEAGIPTDTIVDVCSLLRSPMEMIANYEVTVAPLRTQWNGLRKTAGRDLQQLIDEQSILLQELVELLDDAEQQMKSSRTQLATRLDESQRQSAMRQAYQPAPGTR